MAERFRHLRHLGARFFSSLRAREPASEEMARVRAILTGPELAVWERMPRADRAEAVATLGRLPSALAREDRWAAAALLHDAGKAASGLGTFGRASATVRGHLGDRAAVNGRSGCYLRHAEIGAEILRAAGARTEVVAWAESHHDPHQWPIGLIPEAVCAALAEADGEPTGK